MTDTDERWEQLRDNWEHLGRAAEHFARRVAKDAGKFAERLEAHVGELAADLRREWEAAERRGATAELNKVVDELRGVVGAVLGGVDDLVSDMLSGSARWTRRASVHEGSCAGCGSKVAAGAEAYVRGRGADRDLRCLACGVPKGGAAG
jgi:hypothetical protein